MKICQDCGLSQEHATRKTNNGYSYYECECGCFRWKLSSRLGTEGTAVQAVCSKCRNKWTYIYKLGRKRYVCPECGGIPI